MGKDPVMGSRCGVALQSADVFDQLYAVRKLLEGQWALAVLCALADGPKRYVELLDRVQRNDVTDAWSYAHTTLHQSSLSRILDTLSRDGLILREEKRRSFPPSVTYSLTEPAMAMLDAAGPLAEWADDHPELITRAQTWRRG